MTTPTESTLVTSVNKLSFAKLDQLKTTVEELKKGTVDVTNLKLAYKTFSEGTNNNINILNKDITEIKDKLTAVEEKLAELLSELA